MVTQQGEAELLFSAIHQTPDILSPGYCAGKKVCKIPLIPAGRL
jgi:hypothetical protein